MPETSRILEGNGHGHVEQSAINVPQAEKAKTHVKVHRPSVLKDGETVRWINCCFIHLTNYIDEISLHENNTSKKIYRFYFKK
ncbi:MAG: hypothetical protein K5657_06670 [Desulfovibrio sp.]|nr:hypothetical protein [Desulfovibrio sp.]